MHLFDSPFEPRPSIHQNLQFLHQSRLRMQQAFRKL